MWTEVNLAAMALFWGDLEISPCNLVNFFFFFLYEPCFSRNKEDYQS